MNLTSIIENLDLGSSGMVLLSVAVILILGFLMTRLTKLLHLPNVTAYIICGILIGPYVFNVIPSSFIEKSEFLSDIAVAFIAFGIGDYIKLSTIKNSGKKILLVSIIESLFTMVLLFLLCFFILKLNLMFSLILSSLAIVSNFTSTMMTIRLTKSKGEFVNTILEVMTCDNLLAVVIFSISLSIISTINSGVVEPIKIVMPIIYNLVMIIVGAVFGFILNLMIPKKRTNDNKLIIAISLLFFLCGICTVFKQSPLIACMSMGVVFGNVTEDEKMFKQVGYFAPPILLLFYVRSGMNFNLSAMFKKSDVIAVPLIVISLSYVLVRIIAKYLGAFLAGKITKLDKDITKYLGLSLYPQGSIAIGLMTLAVRELNGTGDVELSSILETVVLTAIILFEIIGPTLADLSLRLSHSYSLDLNETTNTTLLEGEKPSVDLLIKQINEIKKTIPEHELTEEDAFTEAALEQYNYNYRLRRQNRRR